jgi:alkylation response protein AidB-like acyl-CoA dehydrogenase
LEVRADLPRTASGKVQKARLRAELAGVDADRRLHRRVRTELARLQRGAMTERCRCSARATTISRPAAATSAHCGTGLAQPAWPKDYGGLGATPAEVAIVRRELGEFDVPDLYPYLVGLS